MLLGGLVLARAAVYAAYGSGHVIDDWAILLDRQTEGFWHSAAFHYSPTGERPIGWAVLVAIYGPIGAHPLPLLGALTSLNVAAAIVLDLVLRRYVAPAIALACAAVWVLLPSHSTLTVYVSAAPVVAAVLMVLLGLLGLSHGRWVPALLLFPASMLCVELTLPVCIAAALIAGRPMLTCRPEVVPPRRGLRWQHRAAIVGTTLAASLWSILHTSRGASAGFRIPNPFVVWDAHLGTGVFGTLKTPELLRSGLAVAVAVGAMAAVIAFLRGQRDRDGGASLVIAGLAVWALGSGVLLIQGYGPLGLYDRLNAVSSIGAALVVTGVARWLWLYSRAATVAAAGAFVVACVVGQFITLHAWSLAGDDTVALFDHLDHLGPDPGSVHWVVGPGLVWHDGLTGLLPDNGVDEAFRVRYGEGSGSLTYAEATEDLVNTEPGIPVDWASVVDRPFWFQDFNGDGPQGIVEQIVAAPGRQLQISGWALDMEAGAQPLPITVRIGDQTVPVGVADDPRPDVGAAYPSAGPDHGFAVDVIADAPGPQMLCVIADNVGSGMDRPLPLMTVEEDGPLCRSVRIEP